MEADYSRLAESPSPVEPLASLLQHPRFWAVPGALLGVICGFSGLLAVGLALGLLKAVTQATPSQALLLGLGLVGMQLPAAAAVLYCAWRGLGRERWGDFTDLRPPRLRDLVGGVVAGATCVAAGMMVACGVQVTYRILGLEPKMQDSVEMIWTGGPVMLVVLILGAVILAPICEEIFFRLAVFDALRVKLPDLAAGALTAALFASVHVSLTMALPLFTLGVLLQLARHYTRSLWVPMLAHMLFNGTTIGMVLLYRALGIPAPF